jgi:hypothetical protein
MLPAHNQKIVIHTSLLLPPKPGKLPFFWHLLSLCLLNSVAFEILESSLKASYLFVKVLFSLAHNPIKSTEVGFLS